MLLPVKTLFTGRREQRSVCSDLELFKSQQNQKEQHGNKPTSDFCWDKKVIKEKFHSLDSEDGGVVLLFISRHKGSDSQTKPSDLL